MNKFILKHKYLATFAVLAILAWFFYRQFIVAGSPLFPFAAIVIVVWIIGTIGFIYFWPRMTYSAYKRAIIQHGRSGEPIPMNTLYAVPGRSSASAPDASLLATGTSDLLYIGGWLDLSIEPQVLHVPDMGGRYYSVQFTDPADGVNFAYVGKRTTGTMAGNFLITGPGWAGTAPQEMPRISSANHSVMIMGRALVESDNDLAAVYALTQQFKLTPLSQWKHGQ